jgi:hypothetical protein
MQDDKYIVFKREEWEKASMQPAWQHEGPAPLPVEDAVVLRLQDAMAAPFIEGYAVNLGAVAQVLRAHGEFAEADRLQRSADYFHERYNESLDMIKKLPD